MKLLADTFSFQSEAMSPGSLADALAATQLLGKEEKKRNESSRALAKEMAEAQEISRLKLALAAREAKFESGKKVREEKAFGSFASLAASLPSSIQVKHGSPVRAKEMLEERRAERKAFERASREKRRSEKDYRKEERGRVRAMRVSVRATSSMEGEKEEEEEESEESEVEDGEEIGVGGRVGEEEGDNELDDLLATDDEAASDGEGDGGDIDDLLATDDEADSDGEGEGGDIDDLLATDDEADSDGEGDGGDIDDLLATDDEAASDGEGDGGDIDDLLATDDEAASDGEGDGGDIDDLLATDDEKEEQEEQEEEEEEDVGGGYMAEIPDVMVGTDEGSLGGTDDIDALLASSEDEEEDIDAQNKAMLAEAEKAEKDAEERRKRKEEEEEEEEKKKVEEARKKAKQRAPNKNEIVMSVEDMESIRKKLISSTYTSKGPNIKKLFGRMDKDGGGDLDFAEFSRGIKVTAKIVLTDVQLRAIFNATDTDESGTIEVDELIRFVENKVTRPVYVEKPEDEAKKESPSSKGGTDQESESLTLFTKVKVEGDGKVKKAMLTSLHGGDEEGIMKSLVADAKGLVNLEAWEDFVSSLPAGQGGVLISHLSLMQSKMVDMDKKSKGLPLKLPARSHALTAQEENEAKEAYDSLLRGQNEKVWPKKRLVEAHGGDGTGILCTLRVEGTGEVTREAWKEFLEESVKGKYGGRRLAFWNLHVHRCGEKGGEETVPKDEVVVEEDAEKKAEKKEDSAAAAKSVVVKKEQFDIVFKEPGPLSLPLVTNADGDSAAQDPAGTSFTLGVRTGDVIISVQGANARGLDGTGIKDLVVAAGRPLRLGFEREGPAPKTEVKAVAKAERVLPPGWAQFTAKSGKPYYHNAATGSTTWKFPKE